MLQVDFIFQNPSIIERTELALDLVKTAAREKVKEWGFPSRFVKRAARIDVLKQQLVSNLCNDSWCHGHYGITTSIAHRKNPYRGDRLNRKICRATKSLMSDCISFLVDSKRTKSVIQYFQ